MPLAGDSTVYYERTRAVYQRAERIDSDDALMEYLVQFKADRPKVLKSKTARRWFDDLYQQCLHIIAEHKNLIEDENLEQAIEAYRTKMKLSTKFSQEEKQAHIDDMHRGMKRWTAEEIGAATLKHTFVR